MFDLLTLVIADELLVAQTIEEYLDLAVLPLLDILGGSVPQGLFFLDAIFFFFQCSVLILHDDASEKIWNI